MVKISNKSQLTSMYNRRDVEKCSNDTSNRTNTNGLKQVVTTSNLNNPKVLDEIVKDCNKPLQSKWYVESRGKKRFEWYSHNTQQRKFFYRQFGNTVYEIPKDDCVWHDVETIEEYQQKLYNKLKKQYERRLERASKTGDVVVTKQEKLQAETKKRTIQLLNGLANQPRYDRIYSL